MDGTAGFVIEDGAAGAPCRQQGGRLGGQIVQQLQRVEVRTAVGEVEGGTGDAVFTVGGGHRAPAHRLASAL
ncbi:hypothetical protein [Streptomyces sp. NPDC059788]|uniref:hypothetical protein n=1 Tax=Streptomyces sp. NPDC059788 TaxID=3346948 RepID=UPI003658373D